jgi:hypothetical protein
MKGRRPPSPTLRQAIISNLTSGLRELATADGPPHATSRRHSSLTPSRRSADSTRSAESHSGRMQTHDD